MEIVRQRRKRLLAWILALVLCVGLWQGSIYPCGEGAGYAGGITSAAIDGIKTAFAVIKRYKPY